MTLPPFAIDGGLPLALARGVALLGLFSVFGSVLARVATMPPALARLGPGEAQDVERRWRLLVWTSFVVAIAALGAWTWLVAGSLTDTPDLRGTIATLPILLRDTAFGHVALLQLGALALVVLAATRRARWAATGAAAIAVALQAGHSHAAAMNARPSVLLLSDILHLLAGAAWLGGLLPLLLFVATAPAGPAALACRRFSTLGTACVVTLAGTATVQFWILIGGLPGLIGTAYGLLALSKMALFVALLGFAVRNRFQFTPALSSPAPDVARRQLRRSIAGETVVGLMVVVAAGILSSLPPAMHVQPIWPFPRRPSLALVQEVPEFRRDVIAAVLALGVAGALTVVAVVARHRARWLALAAALAIAWFAPVRHLNLLLVKAYPTSYYHSPTGFAATGIVHGGALFPENCAVCHGATGRGDGPAARQLPVPPADLTAAHLWMHSDGEMIWWLSHGIDAPEGGLAMPGFADVLSEEDRWDLIDYIHARNAGVAMHSTGNWPVAMQAPAFKAECAGRRTVTLTDLRGKILRLVIGLPLHPPAVQEGITTIIASPDPATPLGASVCVARDEDVSRAYAIISGLLPGEIGGVQFLIDGDGWLRLLQRPDAAPGWDDPGTLTQAVEAIRAHPMAGAGGGHAGMQM